jgi:hypothetical protein
MICDHHNRVVLRKKDGTRREIIRCADPAGPYFTREVSEEQCSQCPRHLAAVELAARLEAAKCKAQESAATAAQIPQTPGLIRRSMTYAEAVAGWIAAGRPERSDEETRRIFDEHCGKCAWYDQDKQICRGCGCRVMEIGRAVFNKIKMATQHCPRGLW